MTGVARSSLAANRLVAIATLGALACGGFNVHSSADGGPEGDAAVTRDATRSDARPLDAARTDHPSTDARDDRDATKSPPDAAVDVARSDDATHDVSAPRDAPLDVHRHDAPLRDAGHDAAPVVCTSSTCAVVTMASKLYNPIAVAVDGTYVYWLEFGSSSYQGYGELVQILKSAPCLTRSCFGVLDPMVLPQTVANEAAMGLGPGGICYTESFDEPSAHNVNCVPFATGTELSLEEGMTGTAAGVWVGDAGAVWAVAGSTSTSTDGTLRTATFAGAPSTLVSGRSQPWSVTSDGQTAYWTELGVTSGTGAVYALEGDGGARTLAAAQSAPVGIVVYEGYVYWANSGDGTVWRVATPTGSTPEPVASGLLSPIAIAVDGTGVYVAAAGMSPSYLDGTVVQIAAPGVEPVAMLTDQSNLTSVAIDETYVYAAVAGAEGSEGAILRIPKKTP
jgi:hypothetical protein